MNNSGQALRCAQLRALDMVDYLSRLGHQPQKIKGIDYWYLSPLRKERTASFKVNRKLNRWYDHGLGKGGNVIDFAILYHNCTIAELLQNLKGNIPFCQVSFNQPEHINSGNKIRILQEFMISSPILLSYLKQRRIPFGIADQYCREVHYQLCEKIYYSIGFKNDAGGYELRNPYFKNSSAPKGITTIKNGCLKIAVFEGFFDFLSFMAVYQNEVSIQWDFCILNSLSFFEKARPFLEQYDAVHLFLDNDMAGQNCSHYALNLGKRYIDGSGLYARYKDLNEWIVNIGRENKTDGRNIPP